MNGHPCAHLKDQAYENLKRLILEEVFTPGTRLSERQLAARKNCEVLYVEHRAAGTQPAAVAERVNAFLGGSLDVEKMSGVVDNQLYRNRAGQNAGSGAT